MCGLFFQKVYLVQSKIWPFLKQSYKLFQLQAPGNPVSHSVRMAGSQGGLYEVSTRIN